MFDNLQAFLSELKSGHFYSPVGALMPFAGTSAYVPSGWLVCDGRSYAASGASADLQSVLNAAGFSTLPDLQGKVIAGVGTLLGSARSVGASVGSESLPSHTHAATVSETSAGGQAYGSIVNNTNFAAGSGTAQRSIVNTSQAGGLSGYEGNGSFGTAPNHTHSVSVSIANGTDGRGGSSPVSGLTHGVVQPTIVMNYIIKN